MILGCKNESAIPEIGTSSSAMKVVKFTVKSPSSTPEIHHHHHHRHHQIQPSMNNQAAAMAEQQSNKSQNFQVPMGAIPLYDPSSLSPMGIPDLNVSLEEISQRNYSRIMAARARQNRIQICKTKNNGAARVQSPNPCMWSNSTFLHSFLILGFNSSFWWGGLFWLWNWGSFFFFFVGRFFNWVTLICKVR